MSRKRRHSLHVWLHGRHLGTLTETSTFRYRLDFTEEALDTHGEGARILSLSLPVSREPVRDRDATTRPVSAFLQGLLPEGNVRQQVARSARVPVNDVMGLLIQVGAECAGAVQFLDPDATPSIGTVRPLTTGEVDDLVGDLPTYHLPEGASPQASLAGIQDKVLLVALPDGSWGWPEGGAPSSHLVKPEPLGAAVVAHLIESEHWAMEVARSAGITAATTRLTTFGDRAAIVVTRYDRDEDGLRRHQEDFCQALGLHPEDKYESHDIDSSRLRRLVRLAGPRAVDPDQLRVDLLRMVTYNIVIGNGDAHSKNYSLLIGPRGEISLAPLYDCAPVRHLDSRFSGAGHLVNGVSRIDKISLDDLVTEGASWGMSRRRATSVVTETIESTHAAIAVTSLPPELQRIGRSLELLWQERGWRDGLTP